MEIYKDFVTVILYYTKVYKYMAKTKLIPKKSNKAWLSAVFLIIGVGLIYYTLTAPCQVDSIKTVTDAGNVQGIAIPNQEMTIELPWQVEKAMCISTDFMSLISVLIGAAFITSGASVLVKKITT
jgi:hypothetical protein